MKKYTKKELENTEDLKVYSTYNYELFKVLKGNRYVNPAHYKKLLLSIKDNPLPTIITLNENFEVIDGQHRLECFKELNLPVQYIIREGFGLNECQILNINTSKWTLDDYIDGYCDLGFETYKLIKEFKEEYGFKINEAILILNGNISGNLTDEFKKGNFKIENWLKSIEIADKLRGLNNYFDKKDRAKYKSRNLVKIFIRICENVNFDYNHFISQLEKPNPYKLQTQPRVDMTIEMIQNIYNYNVKRKGFIKLQIQ